MSSSICHFCTHGNPAGSKFCNQCGSPLDLKPCSQCDAMNHVSVDRCYQCGTAFATENGVLEVAEVGAAGIPAAESAAAARSVPPPTLYDNPQLGPANRIPVALSDRIDASTERVAIPGQPTHPLTPFADATHSDDIDDDDDWTDPRRLHAARKGLRAERRHHWLAQGALAGICVLVIGAAAYYVLDTGMVPRAVQMARALEAGDERPANVAPAPASPQAPAQASAAPAPPKASADEGTAPAANAGTTSPPAAASSSVPSSASPSAASPAPASVQSPAAAASTAAASPSGAASTPSSSTTTVANAPTERAAAHEPARRVSREPSPRSRPATPPSVDRDALATQRLIERDLAGFLPPEPPPRTLR
jgi:hypothetical protein